MIQDEVIHGRIPRLGTITTGYGVEATSQRGKSYSRPTRSETLVFHSDDAEVATAVQTAYRGDLRSGESPTWAYDVITDQRSVEVSVLPAGFRQALEAWRAAECLRRCDGVTMTTRDGRRTDEACLCAQEIERGQERVCTPHTIVPVLVDLPVERFGVWEIRSNSWGTAAAMKGSMKALAMVGATSGSVPAVVSMVDRQVRDRDGKVRDVTELHLTIARSHRTLTELAGPEPIVEIPADSRRDALMDQWAELQDQARLLGLDDRLRDDWRAMYNGRDFADLDTDELDGWVQNVSATIRDVETALAAERAENDSEHS